MRLRDRNEFTDLVILFYHLLCLGRETTQTDSSNIQSTSAFQPQTQATFPPFTATASTSTLVQSQNLPSEFDHMRYDELVQQNDMLDDIMRNDMETFGKVSTFSTSSSNGES